MFHKFDLSLKFNFGEKLFSRLLPIPVIGAAGCKKLLWCFEIGRRGEEATGAEQVVLSKRVFNYRASVNQVFLDDSFQHGRTAGVVPNSFRVNDGDGTTAADPQAIGFRPVDKPIRSGQFQLVESGLEEFPSRQAGFFGAALWLCGISAKEDMACAFCEAERRGCLAQFTKDWRVHDCG
jgi:hypothetical protein